MKVISKIINFLFGGRINRAEYFVYRLFYSLGVGLVVGKLIEMNYSDLIVGLTLFTLWFLGTASINIKRLNDIDLPWQFVGFSFVPVIFTTFLFFKKGARSNAFHKTKQ